MALTLVDPEIRLSGLTGTLTATGVTAAGAPYDRTKVQYTLDLSNADGKLTGRFPLDTSYRKSQPRARP